MAKHENLSGQRFGRLVALEELGRKSPGIYLYKCRCDCGNEVILPSTRLKNGGVKSCGCLHKEQLIERNKNNRIYNTEYPRLLQIWRAMKHRCENNRDTAYKYYGGKGIKVCKDWNRFDAFQSWSLENGYSDNLTIDRKNSEEDYSPDNCQWVDMVSQNNNKCNNKYLEYKGRTQTLAEWCRELDLVYSRVKARINVCGWSVEEAFGTSKYKK